MATIQNNAEGGSNTTGVTAGNSGGTSGTAFAAVSLAGSSSCTFSNEQAMHGSLSYKMGTSGTDNQYVEWLPTASASAAFRTYVYMPSLPTAGNGFIRLLTAGGGTTLAHVLITNGNVQVQNAAGATVATTSIAPSTGQWLRVEGSITNGNASTGTFNMDWYVGDGGTPISGLTVALTGQNFGTANIGRIRFGRTASFGTWASFYLDSLGFRDSSTTYIGAPVNVPPTVDAGANQNVAAGTVNLVGTATDGDGTIASVAWTYVSATSTGSPTISNDTTLAASFTAGSAPQLYTVQLAATDDGGSTVADTTEVRVPVASGTTMRPLGLNGTGTGTWTIGGGSGNHGAALNDESDSTYVESPVVSSTPSTLKIRHAPSAAKATGVIKERFWTDSGTANVVVKLYEGNTVRQTWSATAVNSTPTEYTYNLDSGTVAAISDWGNLYVEASVTE